MKALFYSALTAFMTVTAYARAPDMNKGFIEVRPGRSLYTEYRLPKNGKPTLYFLNGLTYSTAQWSALVNALNNLDPELGLVLYDMEGMGKTLLKEAPITWDIPLEGQGEDLRALKAKLAIPGTSALLGLSYGGALALDIAAESPDLFDEVIATSPFLERIPDQDVMIKNMAATHRLLYPFDPRSDDQLYDAYLKLVIYSTYPSAEPIVLENPYKLEGIYQMVRGAKDWSAVGKIPALPLEKTHIIAARDDEYVKFDRMQIFLGALPPGKIGSIAVFANTKHKIPEGEPLVLAQWIYQILLKNPAITRGQTFQVDPAKRTAKSGDTLIPLTKVSFCESLL